MRRTAQADPPVEIQTRLLDIVVPYTDQELTAEAIAAAEKLANGLGASVRVLCLEAVPYTMELRQPRVDLDFLRTRLQALPSAGPFRCEIVLTRDADEALLRRLHADSIVMLTSRRHFWRTAQERLADRIRRAGFRVVLAYKEKK